MQMWNYFAPVCNLSIYTDAIVLYTCNQTTHDRCVVEIGTTTGTIDTWQNWSGQTRWTKLVTTPTFNVFNTDAVSIFLTVLEVCNDTSCSNGTCTCVYICVRESVDFPCRDGVEVAKMQLNDRKGINWQFVLSLFPLPLPSPPLFSK